MKRYALPAGLLASVLAFPAGAQPGTDSPAQAVPLIESGEADKALAILNSALEHNGNDADAHNLVCRVYLAERRLDDAMSECEKAASLAPDSAVNHLWLGRVLGEKADQASFLSAYSLAKRVRSELENAAKLDPHNAEALAALGEFDCSAPGIVGGGMDKAEVIAAQLEKVEPSRGHELRAQIAEQRKDYETAEHELREAIRTGQHPAYQWMALASFYRRRERWDEMVATIRSGASAAQRDKHAAGALFNGAAVLIRADRELPTAEKMLEEYLASPNKNEDAPAFVAYGRLARLEDKLGAADAAARDRTAALALAHDYRIGQGSRH